MEHRFAILGLAHWYSAYPLAGAIRTMPGVGLGWIVDENPAQAREAAQLFGAQNWSVSYRDALDDPDVDMVLITAPTDQYERLAVASACANKHILLCKPVARTLGEARRIQSAVEQHGVTLIGYGAGPNPTDPLIRLAREGTIGKAYAVTSSYRARLPLRAPGDPDPGWFVDPTRAAGGAFIDHAIYMVTRMDAIFQSPAKSVYARMRKMARPDLGVEDYGVAIIEYESGALATIESTFGATEYSQNNLTLTGTEGEISISGDELRIIDARSTSTFELAGPNPALLPVEKLSHDPFGARDGDLYSSVIQEMVDVVDHGATTLNSLKSGIRGLEVCLAAYKSMETGLPVPLPLREDVDMQSILGRLDVFHG